ncbi:MAG TPA: hypothetical protein VFA71_01030 [Terriglobales bacterium]|nr:hypothetical protein [Terriglobales bacterium]
MHKQRFAVSTLFCAIVMVASSLFSQTLHSNALPESTRSQAPVQSASVTAAMPVQPADFHPDYGVLSGKHYVNSYFGFSYQYPDGWNGNAIQSSTASQMYSLFTANPAVSGGTDMRYISINADSLGKNATPKDFIKASADAFAGPTGAFNVLHTDKHYVFAGKDFYRVDLVSKPAPGSPVIYQTQVFTFFANYAVTFSFMAENANDIEAMIHSMESLNFSAPDHSATAPVRAATVMAHPQAR